MSFWSRIERRIEDFAGDLLPDEFREELASARDALQSGQLREAEIKLVDLVARRPDHAAALILLGTAQLRLRKYPRSIDSFDAALRLSTDLPEALIGRGNAALALGNAAEAVPYFRAAQAATGGDRELLSEAYRGLGLAYRKAGELDKAIRELRKAVAESDDDPATIADLGDALSADQTRPNGEARRYLTRLADENRCPPVAWLALGRIALRDEDSSGALQYFHQVVEGSEEFVEDESPLHSNQQELLQNAYVGIAKAHLLAQAGDEAKAALTLAQQHGDKSPTTLALLAQADAMLGDHSAAMRHYQRALSSNAGQCPPSVSREALALALRTGDLAMGVEMANRVLAIDSSDSNALTARGLQLAAAGQEQAARATYEQATKQGDAFEAYLASAKLAFSTENYSEASTLASRALRLRPISQRARALQAQSATALLGVHLQEKSSWYDLAAATSKLCSSHPELLSLSPQAGLAIAEYDQPLLVAVMGEFSSGKSSFVNAFVGTQVAPIGITPTTATINIVKYGRSRSGRVVYRDHTSRELQGDNLVDELRSIDDNEARRVAHVEILMPMDVLERVNIIDTPGLNSILPEHEAVARAFLKRADAVVWLFTVNQAGKSTEKSALDSIRETGVRVLGVLNKVDQLSSEQVEEVLGYVKTELGDRVEACIPISARRAMLGQEESGWSTLRDELETRFFAQARELKKQALNRRLTRILTAAAEVANKRLSLKTAASQVLLSASEDAEAQALVFLEEVVEKERMTVQKDASALYKTAAKEVLELVRPRKLPFGSHKATRADRDYLLGLLDSGFESLLEDSKARCLRSLQEGSGNVLSSVHSLEMYSAPLQALISEGLQLATANVWDRCLAFVQGYLRGGFVDHFFEIELAKIDLSEDAIYQALFLAAPELDSQISMPLARAGEQLFGTLARRLEQLSELEEVAALEMDSGLHQAVCALEEHRLVLANAL